MWVRSPAEHTEGEEKEPKTSSWEKPKWGIKKEVSWTRLRRISKIFANINRSMSCKPRKEVISKKSELIATSNITRRQVRVSTPNCSLHGTIYSSYCVFFLRMRKICVTFKCWWEGVERSRKTVERKKQKRDRTINASLRYWGRLEDSTNAWRSAFRKVIISVLWGLRKATVQIKIYL